MEVQSTLKMMLALYTLSEEDDLTAGDREQK
jgi:hypothetical protein